MPVLSPHRSSAYRSSLGSSALDKPFYGSTNSYNPRYSFSERFTTRSYTDCDGRRTFTRSGSITEDGVTTRFHEETREKSLRRDSVSRDSGIGSIRENSVLDTTRRDRENSATRSEGGRYSTVNIAESIADLRNRYSPANYVPAVHRNRESHGRSKSINGLPPTDRAEPKVGVEKKKVNDGVICNNTAGLPEFANNTNQRADDDDNAHAAEDDNGNRQPVSEIRKRFEPKTPERPDNARRCDEKRPPSKLSKSNDRLDRLENDGSGHGRTDEERNDVGVKFDGPESKFDAKNDAVLNNLDKSTKLTVPRGKERSDDGLALGGKSRDSQDSVAQDESSDFKLNGGENSRSANRVNNFSSYISTRDYEKGDDLNGARENDEDANENRNDTMDNSNRIGKSRLYTDKTDTTSPRLNRTVSQNASSSSSNATSSNSVGRNVSDDDRPYDRRISSSPNRHQGLNGLKNIGNTCFMNSVIQCLSNTKPLLEYVRKDMYISDINTSFSSMKGALIKAFSQVIKEVWSEDSSDRVVNTVSLKSQIQRFAPRFMGYSQQDAQEFLRYLLEGLHEDVNRVTNKPAPIHTEIDEKLSDSEKSAESWQRYLRMDNSKIVDIFVGQLKSTLRCTYCGHCSVTFDPFWDLSLPIPQKAGPVRLQQCLESFTREETLDGDEKPVMTCSKCKERRKCTKSFSIQKFPKILVIHLKRFSPTERFRGKLSVNIDFPLEGLDMSNYAADNRNQCRYNLYAISNHSGTTYSGHYTAYCRHPYSLSWHEYNDSRVSTISPKSIISGEAYVLFYEQDSQKAHL